MTAATAVRLARARQPVRGEKNKIAAWRELADSIAKAVRVAERLKVFALVDGDRASRSPNPRCNLA
jgi:hypothetical protein